MPDTCVWINFLEHADLRGPLMALEELVAEDVVKLWTTEEILSEVKADRRKKIRLAEAEKLRDAGGRIDAATELELREAATKANRGPRLYDRIDHIEEAMVHVDDLLLRSRVIAGSEAVNGRVLYRIAKGLAPFHRSKKDVRQSVNDGIIIEKFASAVTESDAESDICVFISLNKTEFATATNADEAHSHYADIFNDRCFFTKSIERTMDEIRELVRSGQASRRIRPSDRKSWDEIQAEIAKVGEHEWFYRHLARKKAIADGVCRLQPGRNWFAPLRPPRFGAESWREDLATAEQKLTENPGLPRTENPYDAGFAAGASTALKWVLGDGRSPGQALHRQQPDKDPGAGDHTSSEGESEAA